MIENEFVGQTIEFVCGHPGFAVLADKLDCLSCNSSRMTNKLHFVVIPNVATGVFRRGFLANVFGLFDARWHGSKR